MQELTSTLKMLRQYTAVLILFLIAQRLLHWLKLLLVPCVKRVFQRRQQLWRKRTCHFPYIVHIHQIRQLVWRHCIIRFAIIELHLFLTIQRIGLLPQIVMQIGFLLRVWPLTWRSLRQLFQLTQCFGTVCKCLCTMVAVCVIKLAKHGVDHILATQQLLNMLLICIRSSALNLIKQGMSALHQSGGSVCHCSTIKHGVIARQQCIVHNLGQQLRIVFNLTGIHATNL
mmetsp:Transcript_18093/g.28603  ORF Transcript_18093/g.28603 Transcript_18093/m.28603 type:complete len:228 (+) Transcript_18093:770-1453(+)